MFKRMTYICLMALLLLVSNSYAQNTGVRLETNQRFVVNSYSVGSKSKSGHYRCSFSLSGRDSQYIAKVKFRTPSFMNYSVSVYDQKNSVIEFGKNGLPNFSVTLPVGTYIENYGGMSPTQTNIPVDVEIWSQCNPS